MVAEDRQITHFSCIRRANLALCTTVLRRGRARHRDGASLWQYFGLSDTNELTLGEYFYDIDHHT
jgi:hypothetical protein